MAKFSFGGGTNVGNKRLSNEDSYKADISTGLWIIADGMGGAKAGDVASNIAVNKVVSCIKKGIPLADSILNAHQAIVNTSSSHPDIAGMGSTIVALKCGVGSDANSEYNYEIAWVGDSRAYLWDKQLSRLTKDHSYVQHLIDKGEIDQSNAWGHAKSNVIIQALGMINKNINVDTYTNRWFKGQKILLCSDGLHGELRDDEIETLVSQDLPNQEIVDQLIDAALTKGGKDNISALLISSSTNEHSLETDNDETIPFYANEALTTATKIKPKTTEDIKNNVPNLINKQAVALALFAIILLVALLIKFLIAPELFP